MCRGHTRLFLEKNMSIDIEDLTLRQIREIREIRDMDSGSHRHPYQIGANYLIRTVTMALTGRMVAVFGHELVLEDAAWIPDTGRFADAVKSADFSEVEPFPDGPVIIGRHALIDAAIINALPRSQK
jgi:hypothetical protein